MNNKLSYLLRLVLVSIFVLASCGPVTPVPIKVDITKESPSIQVQEDQVGPHLVGQNPPAGQRLELLPSLEFTFDREMDQAKTADSFTLLDSNNKPVPGKKAWTDAKTFSFKPDSKLEPSSVYQAEFSTSAIARDGQALQEKIRLDLMTIDLLAVGQVFPVDRTEDIDPTTNITVIFNHPVVPLQIKEEQNDLPQPLIISPDVTGHGEWVNSSVYVFQPEKGLLSGTNYKVKVDAGLKDVNGEALQKSYTWNFSTRAPLIGNFALKNGQQNPPDTIDNVLLDQAFIVTFLQPMDEQSVKDAVTLVNRESGQSFPTKLTWDKELTTLTIEPIGKYAIASFYDLNIADTARASDGGKLKDGWHLKFGTVPLPKIVDIFPKPNSDASASGGKGFNSDIAITFASPMRLDSLKIKIKITPQPRKGLDWYFNDSNWQLQVFGLEPSTEYVVRILPGMSDIYGNTIKEEQSFTFTTGEYTPSARLILPWTPLVYRAKGPQEVYFEHLNLDSVSVSLYRVDFSHFNQMLLGNSDPTNFNPKEDPIREWTPDVNVPRNILNSVKLKLEDAQEKPLAPGYYFIGVRGKPLDYKSRFYQASLFIVATDNITFKTSSTDASAWVTDLESGKPQAGVSVALYNEKFVQIGNAVTDKDGLTHLDKLNNPVYASVDDKGHFAFTAIDWGSGVWVGDFGLYEQYYSPPNSMFGYMYTDRPVYRPGQEVFFKGIVRQNDDLHYSLSKTSKVYLTIEQNGERVFGDYMSLSDLGSFTGKLKLADDAALGTYDVMLRQSASGDPFSYLSFRVAEYHKPEFEVSASSDKGNVLAGEQVKFSLDAKYYSGGNLGNANTDWFIESAPYYFQPSSKYQQFNFMDWDRDMYWTPQENNGIQTLANGSGVTDAAGHFDVTQLLGENENKTSQQVTFSANVTDVSGNVVSGSTSVTVHQSEFYAGVRSTSYVGQQGKESPFEVVVLDWDSNPVPNQKVSVKFVERRWYSVQTQDKQGTLSWETSVKEIPVSTINAVTGDDGKVTVSFVPPAGGVYKAIVTVQDTKRHTQSSSAYTWVSSDSYIAWRQTNDRAFNLIADKDTYSPGDTAEILIAQPFTNDVYALVTYERGHVYKQEVVLLKGNSTVYKLPITEDMAPISYVSVTVISGAEAEGTPDFKIGMASIKVDTSHQTLDVQVSADKKSAGPGDDVTYTIETKDYNGKPVSADVSLAVVDKAALALAPMNSMPILDAFYSEQALSVRTALGLVSNADDFNAQYRESIPDGGGAGGGGGDEVSLGIITTRKNFKDTAYFEGQVTTDKDGKAQITVTLPENLTTWKADVRAVTVDSKVGQTTSDLLSTKPLFIEMQTPRFFINGDQATVGATIHNNTDKALSVKVSLDAKGVDLLSAAAQDVDVPAGTQKTVKWDATVQGGVKRVDFTASAVSGTYSDASKPALGTLSDQGIPVYNYVTTETVGTSGVLQNANSATEAIQLPQSLNFTDAKLSVEVSPSLAASMQNGLTYLDDYPYLCMEQTVSRFLPNVITSRALKNAGIPSTAVQSNLDAQVAMALQRIYAKQHYDGGWNWWDGDQSDLQTSAYVVYGLIEAKASGYDISTSVLNNGLNYLTKNVPSLNRNDATWQYNRTAFILYVLARADQLRPSQVNFIYENRTSLSLYGKAYLAQAMYMLDAQDERVNSLLSDLETASVLSSSGAHWEESSTDYWNWNTDTRTTAIVLNAFVQLDPKNPITANAVRWLMAHRDSGHWDTTQETAWSLIALTNWMTAANEYNTDYAYAIGLNGNVLNQGNATKDNLTETVNLQVQMKDLLKDAANYLVFTRGDGTGNLYYTAYLSTELPVESIQPLDQGVSISRQYFTLDNSKKPITDATRGDLVRVRLTVVVPAAMHYIVVDDPLPAGFEAVDSSILTDTAVPSSYTLKDYNERGWGWWYFSHVELRDEKVVLSADYLPAGTYVYTYLARASTVGTFKVIPPTASEFYFPDVGGRGAGSVFEVKP